MIRHALTGPILRRLFAAVVLFGCGAGSVLFWNSGELDPLHLTVNIAVASAGMVWLHWRWRAQECRRLSADQVEEIFS